MTKRLTELQAEARERWINYKGRGVITHEEEWLEELITHIYTQAVEDCREALPREDVSQPKIGAMLDDYIRAGWNSCRKQTDIALTALLPK